MHTHAHTDTNKLGHNNCISLTFCDLIIIVVINRLLYSSKKINRLLYNFKIPQLSLIQRFEIFFGSNVTFSISKMTCHVNKRGTYHSSKKKRGTYQNIFEQMIFVVEDQKYTKMSQTSNHINVLLLLLLFITLKAHFLKLCHSWFG